MDNLQPYYHAGESEAASMTEERAEEIVEVVARAIAPAVSRYIPDYDEVPPEHIWSRPRYEWLSFAMVQIANAALAEARPLIEAETREKAAKVADGFEAQENERAYDKRQAGRDDNFNCARASAAAHIAQSIRSMGGH